MKPPPFDYFAPGSLEEAVRLLGEHEGEARVLAGGQSLLPLLNMRLARPRVLVDLGKIPGLEYIRELDGTLAIGAMTRKSAVEHSELVVRRQPMLHAATLCVGHPQIRNRGTVGGSLAQADPAAEYPALALALDAELRVVGPQGGRCVQAAAFFLSYLTTALGPAELLTEIRLPVRAERSGWSFMEVTRRRGDFAIAGAAVTLTLAPAGSCSQARIVLFGVEAVPRRAREAETLVLGERPVAGLFEQAARRAGECLEAPLSDVHAGADYRRELARVLTRRALAEAAGRALEAS